jgi:hypothetical protein
VPCFCVFKTIESVGNHRSWFQSNFYVHRWREGKKPKSHYVMLHPYQLDALHNTSAIFLVNVSSAAVSWVPTLISSKRCYKYTYSCVSHVKILFKKLIKKLEAQWVQTKIRDYFLYGDQSYSAVLVPCCNSFYSCCTLHW